MKITELHPGDSVLGFFLLSGASKKITTTGKPFLTMVLSDRSGSIEAKVWDYSGPIGSEDAGKIIKISGTVSEYRGAPQITVDRLRMATAEDTYDLSALVPTAPIDLPAAYADVERLLQGITDPDYRALSLEMLRRKGELFRKIPAGKAMHHAFVGGLLMHTHNMMRIAAFLGGLYADTVDRSLLLAGTFMHDLSKSAEFDISDVGLVTEYTVPGKLVGHLVMGAMEIRDLCREMAIPEEKSMLLQHMVLSHHGEPDFGAAVRCQCAEAELLSYIDMLDSRMEIYAEAFQKTEVGQFSEKVFALDGKKLYRHADLSTEETV